MLLGAIVFLVVLPVVLIVVRNRPEEMGLEPDGGQLSNGKMTASSAGISLNLGEAVKTLPYWLMTVLMLCYGLTFGSMTQHAIALLRSQGIGEPGLFWSFTLGISVLGRLTFGALADRISKKGLISMAWLFHIMGLASALALPHLLPLVITFALFYGAGQGGFSTVFPVRLGELFGTGHFSKLYGTILFFQAIGFSVGTVMFGKIFDSMGSYRAALSIVVVTALMCLVTSRVIRQPGARCAVQTQAT
jgi:MFS family permease